jgi:cytochrome P450
MLAQGKATTNNGIFQIKSPVGYKVMLPPVFANELRNNPDLSFAKSMQLDFHTHLPGFAPIEQGIRNDGLLVDVVRLKLTQSLGPITEDIVEEADLAIQRWPGKAPGPEWKTVSIKEGLLDVISRVSGRVFGGEQLSRDEEWLEINKQYTSESFGLAMRLHAWPMLLRRIANWVLEPAGKNIRAQIAAAQRLVAPQVEQRLKAREDALAKGTKNKGQNDVFHWLLDVAKGRKFDFAIAQLGISVAALHTTTEMNSQCLLFAAQHPEVVAALREEMVQVLREGGWAKTTLYKLKLLDSFIKECQRLHGPSTNSMIRVCQAPVTLSTGLSKCTNQCCRGSAG